MGKKSAHDEPGYTMEPKPMGPKGCEVCGRTGIEGEWGVVYSSTVDKKKLHVCLGCFAHRDLPFMKDVWRHAVDKAFPNLVQYWANKPKEDENGKTEEKAGEAGGAGGTGQAGQNEDEYEYEDNAK